MALNFTKTAGHAIKNSHPSYTYKDGENTVRLVGGVLPRYVYWLKGTNNKDVPVECLAFSREDEKFNNKDKDYVQEYFPEAKCSWAYAINCLVNVDGVPTVLVLNLKKKMFEQVMTIAETLGDPTDLDTGWSIVFKKAKTGPLPFNVEYTVNALKCKNSPLSTEEKTAVVNALDIDAKFPRPTSDDVKATLERLKKGISEEETSTGTDAEAVSDLTP